MLPTEIVDHMMANDAFSRWLSIDVKHVSAGSCTLELRVREQMTNGFHVAHGGISYSLADSALAFAANAHGEHAMSIECHMSYLKAVKPEDVLVATATEVHRSKRLGRYNIVLHTETSSIGLFRGVVMFLGKEWAHEPRNA